MNNTISVYDLLGLIKDGKAPKKIKYNFEIWELVYKDTINGDFDYQDECGDYLLSKFLEYNYLTSIFSAEVEILEEDKPIIEKIKRHEFEENGIAISEQPSIIEIVNKLNQVIDYINRKEDK